MQNKTTLNCFDGEKKDVLRIPDLDMLSNATNEHGPKLRPR